MKNKFKIIISILFIYCFILNVHAIEDFKFESKIIEIDSDNNITAQDGVKATSNDGLEILANNSFYNKKNRILKLNKDVSIIDKIQNVILESDNIIYDKNLEKITSTKKTKINIDNKHLINGEDIIFLRTEFIIQSNKITFIKDKYNNEIKLNGFHYFVKDKLLKSKEMEFTDNQSNIYKSSNAMIDLNNERIAAKDIEIYFAKGELGDDARLKGSSLLSENNISVISNGIFTTCKIREKCPPWSLKSKEISHDKTKKIINYKNSWLQLYDVPIFYFPKFFHPDPTVKRQSGFLTPSILSSSTSGGSVSIPYFNAISENKDFTFSPRIFFNDDFLIQNEYRQVEKNTTHISDFSIKKLDNSTKSHFFSNTKHSFENNFDLSEVEINLEKTSNDTYLKGDNIKSKTRNANNQSLLNSFIKYNANNEDLDIFIEASVYEDLTKEKNSDKFQYIFPNFTISKLLSNDTNYKGNLNYQISGSSQKKDTNVNESYVVNDVSFSSNSFFSNYGTISNYEILLKNSTTKGDNSDTYSNKTQSDNYTSFIFNSSVPLKKNFKNYIANLSPKLTAMYSPNKSENLIDLDRKINITNLFSSNRLGLSDSVEGGQSLTLGFDYDLKTQKNEDFLGFSLGQIFRDRNDKKLPTKSKMQNKSSDVIGNFKFQPNDNFRINYDFSADNSLDTMNYTKVETQLNINNFLTSFEFLEENNEIGSDSYLLGDVKYNFNSNNSIAYNTRRNRKTNLTEYYNFIYEYKNDCLVAAIEYNKDYYQDRDLQPNEQIFFSLTITPFTSINSPSLK